jgi:hypothetical protein
MNIKEALLQFLNEKSLGLSKQEIEKILHDELEKPESEIDCEIIDMCIELLAEIEHIPLPDDNIPVPPAPPIVHPAKKKRRWKAVLLVAAIFVVFVSATLFVSAQVFHFDIVHYVVELFSDHVSVDYDETSQQAGSYLPADTDLRKELESNGISPVLLPDEFLNGAQIQVEYQATDLSKSAKIYASKDSEVVDISIIQYLSKELFGEVEHQGEIVDSREVTVGDIAILVMDFGERRTIAFVDDNTQYIIETTLDMESAVQLAETIQ